MASFISNGIIRNRKLKSCPSKNAPWWRALLTGYICDDGVTWLTGVILHQNKEWFLCVKIQVIYDTSERCRVLLKTEWPSGFCEGDTLSLHRHACGVFTSSADEISPYCRDVCAHICARVHVRTWAHIHVRRCVRMVNVRRAHLSLDTHVCSDQGKS